MIQASQLYLLLLKSIRNIFRILLLLLCCALKFSLECPVQFLEVLRFLMPVNESRLMFLEVSCLQSPTSFFDRRIISFPSATFTRPFRSPLPRRREFSRISFNESCTIAALSRASGKGMRQLLLSWWEQLTINSDTSIQVLVFKVNFISM